jgi:hypothetical protein
MGKQNFRHIAIRNETKKTVDELKEQLAKKYSKATYDELLLILLNKHEKFMMSEAEIKKLLAKSRGVKI